MKKIKKDRAVYATLHEDGSNDAMPDGLIAHVRGAEDSAAGTHARLDLALLMLESLGYTLTFSSEPAGAREYTEAMSQAYGADGFAPVRR